MVAGSFNGAAIFQSRKSYTETPTGTIDGMLQWGRDLSIAEIDQHKRQERQHYELQWGRDLSIAEIRPIESKSTENSKASMGPRSFNRGNARLERPSPSGPTCFNGAAIFQSRKSIEHGLCDIRSNASMGPRSFNRGNLDVVEHNQLTLPLYQLQWGRDLSIAEIKIEKGDAK